METVDDTTLVIHYTHPYFAYLNDFCWNDVMTICAPSLLIEGDFQTVSGVSGTGPYVYDEYVAGEYTRFVRNENYWGDTPYWDEIIVKYIPDSTSRIQALQTGEIDMIYGSALLTYEEYQQASTLPGMAGQMADLATRARDITLNASRPALNDLRVRQAIAYGNVENGRSTDGKRIFTARWKSRRLSHSPQTSFPTAPQTWPFTHILTAPAAANILPVRSRLKEKERTKKEAGGSPSAQTEGGAPAIETK